MEKGKNTIKQVIFAKDLKIIENLHGLKKIGAGHDGIVYQYENKAIKELKYDIEKRKYWLDVGFGLRYDWPRPIYCHKIKKVHGL